MHNVAGALTDCVSGDDGAAGLLLTGGRVHVRGQPLQPTEGGRSHGGDFFCTATLAPESHRQGKKTNKNESDLNAAAKISSPREEKKPKPKNKKKNLPFVSSYRSHPASWWRQRSKPCPENPPGVCFHSWPAGRRLC